MSALPTAWISHRDCLLHDNGPDHPECPDRLRAIQDYLVAHGTDVLMQPYQAPPAERHALERVHTPEYVETILSQPPPDPGEIVYLDPDTSMNAHTLDAALRAAGAAVLATDLVLERKAGLAFCAVRPPGHHAEPNRAMGFCLFNNVAVGAAHALARGVERVAVLDFDLHHGNGTARMFGRHPQVRVYQTYEEAIYPQWRRRGDMGSLIDAPLQPYDGSEALRAAVGKYWLPSLYEFRPQLLYVSAGFDGHAQDPLGDLQFSSEDYGWLAERIREVAHELCEDRVVATLEGGYNLAVLGRCVNEFLRPFLGSPAG
jgi:acetoin utilization deacetylase AcuC-like enzyme